MTTPDQLPPGSVSDGTTLGVSPKALAAIVAPLLVGVVLSGFFALLDYVIASPELLASLPAWVQVVIVAALASLAAGTAAYRARPGVIAPSGTVSSSHRR